MEDPVDDAAPTPDDGGGLTGFLTSARGVITAVATLIIAVSGLITALKATGVIGADDPAPTTERLFPALKNPNGRVYYEGDTMYVTASRPGRPLLQLVDGEEERTDVVLTARVDHVSGAPDFGVGFVCRYRSAANYYLLAVLSNGGHNIVRYRSGKPTFLSRGRGTSTTADEPREVTARCLGDTPTVLSLSVDGKKAGGAQDPDGIEQGTLGLRVGSSESRVTLTFEDVVLR